MNNAAASKKIATDSKICRTAKSDAEAMASGGVLVELLTPALSASVAATYGWTGADAALYHERLYGCLVNLKLGVAGN